MFEHNLRILERMKDSSCKLHYCFFLFFSINGASGRIVTGSYSSRNKALAAQFQNP